MTPHSLRLTAIAGLTALSALAGASAQAAEATQWDPQADQSQSLTAAVSSNPSRFQNAWATRLGEATQFHDGMTRASMKTRAEVRNDYNVARNRGLLNDTGEGGATERVLACREAYGKEEHERIVALNTPTPEVDELGAMIAALTPADGPLQRSQPLRLK